MNSDAPHPEATPQPSPFAFSSSLITIEQEMERSYLDYAMSVIVSRALPDVRDGLKPVHRRILHAMKESGYDAGKPYRKSARIVGTVMGKYHPHGDSAIYDAMVRMAQDFSLRLPLIDGQGNFGSMDGDAAAAMRYTEARLAESAEMLLIDIDKDTVNFTPNYDESEQEPVVLPARFPNLLVNGANGIAVGMATNIPPHNLGELIDAAIRLVDNPDLSYDELLAMVPGPDFPTGGVIHGRLGIVQAATTGRGSIPLRAVISLEEMGKDRTALIVSEIPYQVNKAKIIERIAELVREKTIEGISDLRDESDRDGVRIVVEVKRGHEPEVVREQLYRHTQLQTSFSVNMLALDLGRPRLFTLRDALNAFNEFREEVIRRRTACLLAKARERAHVLAGLLVAIANLDPVINLIRQARDPAEARLGLTTTAWPAGEVEPFIALIDDPGHQVVGGVYYLSDAQARAILDLRLQRLTGLELEKLQQETKDLAQNIAEYLEILTQRAVRLALLQEELREVKAKFATPRRTQIEDNELDGSLEDLIQREDMVVTETHGGYIKRVPLSTYRAQRRGGKGRSGMTTKEDDFVSRIFVGNTHQPLLFFSSIGMVYKLKIYQLPLAQPQSKGKAIVNLLPLKTDETITTIMALPEDESSWSDLSVMFVTSMGNVRRNRLSDFTSIRSSGKIAMKLTETGESLIGVRTCSEMDDIMLATRGGSCLRFPVAKLRIFESRSSTGVRGMTLEDGDEVSFMTVLRHREDTPEDRQTYLQAMAAARRIAGLEDSDDQANTPQSEEGRDDRLRDQERAALLSREPWATMQAEEQFVLSLTASGMGQLASAYDFRITNRGGKGITTMETDGSPIIATFRIDPKLDQVMLVTDAGQIIRCPVEGIRPKRRGGKGIRIFDVGNEQKVVSVARITLPAEDDNPNGSGASELDATELGATELGGSELGTTELGASE